MELLFILIGLILICFASALHNKNTQVVGVTEAFADLPNLLSCPAGLNMYYGKSGDPLCCKGTVSGNSCDGITKCCLSSSGCKGVSNGKIPSCVGIQKKYYANQSKIYCPKTMSNFYVNKNGQKFCTAGKINSSMDGPLTSSQKKCSIYSDVDSMKYSDPNSCYNQKQLANIKCFGTDCIKSVRILPNSGSSLISVEFTDKNGTRRSTFTRSSLKRHYENVGMPANMDLSKNVTVTEVAKAVFVDRTRDIGSVQV